MMQELFEQERVLKTEDTEGATEVSELQKYLTKYEQAMSQENFSAARYYLGKSQDALDSKELEIAEESPKELHFGSREANTEKIEEERRYLERKLRDAKANFNHAAKALDKLVTPNAGATRSMISDREYQVKIYQKDIQNLERELSRL